MAEPTQIQVPAGAVWCTTYGQIRGETAQALMEARSFSERNGLANVRWAMMPSTLVEKARNECCRQTLADANFGWMMFIDGDMVFDPNAVVRMVQTAFGSHQYADVLGGYCNLRGDPALPTTDTGTGTWESCFPGSGPIEVMRTGAAFLLVKRHVLTGLNDPWFRIRVPSRPIDFMEQVDNYARIKFDGENPFRRMPSRAWERLMQCAVEDPSASGEFVAQEVGEDSGFCDRAKLAGFRIFVDTNIVTGHVDTKIVDYRQHKTAMDNLALQQRYVVGVLR